MQWTDFQAGDQRVRRKWQEDELADCPTDDTDRLLDMAPNLVPGDGASHSKHDSN